MAHARRRTDEVEGRRSGSPLGPPSAGSSVGPSALSLNDALLEEIVAEPENDDPRLVWADRAGGERGELVVLQCALAKRSGSRSDRVRMATRVRELLRLNGRKWTSLQFARFERGFPVHGEVELTTLADELKAREFFDAFPLVTSIDLVGLGGSDVNRYAGPRPNEVWAENETLLKKAIPLLSPRVTAITASPTIHESGDWSDPGSTYVYGQQFIELVVELPSLRSLKMYGAPVGPPSLPFLAKTKLESLMTETTIATELLAALPSLRALCIQPVDVDVAGPRLSEIRLADATDEAVTQLAKHPIESLSVSNGRITDRAVEALASGAIANSLRSLDLTYGKLTKASVPKLVSLQKLEELRITGINALRVPELDDAIPSVVR